jgi:hypothetical protein
MEEFIKTRAFPWIVAGVVAIIVITTLGNFTEIRKVKKLLKETSKPSKPYFNLVLTKKEKTDPFQDDKSADESLFKEAEEAEAKGEPEATEDVAPQKEGK